MEQKTQVYIVGPMLVQNATLFELIRQQLEVECFNIRPEECAELKNSYGQNRRVILYDYMGNGQRLPWEIMDMNFSTLRNDLFCIFNLQQNEEIEKEALSRGVCGVFYDDTPADVFIKGIRSVLNGELWFSRKVMALIINNSDEKKGQEKLVEEVTKRERDILSMIMSGYDNRAIAGKLHISVHTVKSHLYHIYSKIGVTNRTQAALWAGKNL